MLNYSSALIFFVFSANSYARELEFNDSQHPIQKVKTSFGQGNRERIDELTAIIQYHHIRANQRVSFPLSGELETKYQAIKADGDERGHLVASQFSGPPEWFNLSPQNQRVNRNVGYNSITKDWYGTECEVRKFLDGGNGRSIKWQVKMKYDGNSNRPKEYRLKVSFYENGKEKRNDIETTIKNPLCREDSNFWICRSCRNNRHDSASSCTRQ